MSSVGRPFKSAKYLKSRRYEVVFQNRILSRIRRHFRRNGDPDTVDMDFLGYTKRHLVDHLFSYIGKPCEEKRKCNGIILTLKNSSIDHALPVVCMENKWDLVRINQLDNLRMICLPCNMSKRNRVPKNLGDKSMGLFDELLPKVNIKEIEKNALEAKQLQVEMLEQLKQINVKLEFLARAAEYFTKGMDRNR
jgi:hypothetical protein